MKAKILFQPKPGSEHVLASVEVSDGIPNPQKTLVEACSAAMQDAMGESPRGRLSVLHEGRLVPFQEYRKAAGI